MNYQEVEDAIKANRDQWRELVSQRRKLLRSQYARGKSVGQLLDLTNLPLDYLLTILDIDPSSIRDLHYQDARGDQNK